jgi:hypothetical protein
MSILSAEPLVPSPQSAAIGSAFWYADTRSLALRSLPLSATARIAVEMCTVSMPGIIEPTPLAARSVPWARSAPSAASSS